MNLSPPSQNSTTKLALDRRPLGPILALETSGKSASVAIEWPDDRVVCMKTDPTIGSARTLAPAIATILKTHSVAITELVAIAVTVGPGSFTGLRVGVATAKSMAYALNIPTIAVDSLEAMAWEAAHVLFFAEPPLQKREPIMVWTVLDAYRGELFAAYWELQPSDTGTNCTAIVPSRMVDSVAWTDALLSGNLSLSFANSESSKKAIHPSVVLVGSGLSRCQPLLDSAARMGFGTRADLVPQASMVARIGRRKLIQNETVDSFQLMPVYLRGSAAEEKRLRDYHHP